ncbi:nucleotidyl transferase AbiEii/AbiGii toxin family protein [Microcoleus sp. FACHB-1515]|uniref:nucleotidyl transferase AbiEii/AbiGii toxin family protein n=1 Tax=Cyanophyceae TaxID=3028117 RepID=UPI0016849DFC|nr:nucleotidyl transferase AbiEii/AbiGii toxin family protein [Microcoleus sp. FACHB-1515]MBD2093350.1 nucleotidyl transferase AbiEii/AbiGii toxin family protein [Microcoleus sp. FACHB-1515]
MNLQPPISELPFLRSICWQGEVPNIDQLAEIELLQLYERNWRYRDRLAPFSEVERQFVQSIATKHQSWLASMFEMPVHNQILQVLRSLKPSLFEACNAYFGGGTLLTLCYGEYRLSRDIDFLCAYGADFSRLRRAVYDEGVEALFDRPVGTVGLPRELQTDRDGVRMAVTIDALILKLEIMAEGRIALDAPSYPAWSPVPCLSVVDQVAEKLLANSDRWAESATHSRDLIDLAMLRRHTHFPQRSIEKAEAVYPCIDPLKRAIVAFQAQPDDRIRCYERLAVRTPTRVIDGLDQLASQFDLPLTERLAIESQPFPDDE